jgi:hypothetical protein
MDRFMPDKANRILFQTTDPNENKEGKASVIFEDSFFGDDNNWNHGLINNNAPPVGSTKLQSFLLNKF